MKNEAKLTPDEEFNAKADEILDKHEASSTSEETSNQESGADQTKNANLDKKVETPEDKLSKIKEILGDDEKAIDAYIKSKGYHTDPAWQKLLAKSKTPAIDEDTQKRLEEFNKVTSSREYIETKMKAEGYKQEAIESELQKRGFDIGTKSQDDVKLVIDSLGINPESLDDNTRATISDVAKVVDVILKDRMGKTMPGMIKPLEESVATITQRNEAITLTNKMTGIIEAEGVLDFEKDIAPELDKWIDENPKSKQSDVFNKFLELNHKLSLERLMTGKKRADNQEVKKGLRTPIKSNVSLEGLPKKTGDFHEDADAVLDHFGVR